MSTVTIKRSELPPINSETESYLIRYRIISNDKNRASYWSPIFEISSTPDFTIQTPTVKSQFDLITIAWPRFEPPMDPGKFYTAVMPNYDVWIAWDSIVDEDFEYIGRTSDTSKIIAKKSGSNKISIKVYFASSIISLGPETENFKYIEQLNVNI